MRERVWLLWGSVVAAAAFVTVHPASSQTCEPTAHLGHLHDRSWVRSDAVLYGAGTKQGVIRLQLNSNEVNRIGDHASEELLDFQVSPDRSKLFYKFVRSPNHPMLWIFDIQLGREASLAPLTDIVGADSSSVAFSPDSTRVAAKSMFGRGLAILNLTTHNVRSINLNRLGAVADGELFFGLAWSYDDNTVLFGRRDREHEDYWAADAAGGAIRPIDVQSGTGDDHALYYANAGVELGRYCMGCDRPVALNEIALAKKMRAVVGDDGQLSVVSPKARTVSVETVSPSKPIEITPGKAVDSACGGGRVALYAAFDGRYLLYAKGGTYWIYGVDERRKAILWDRPDTILVW